MAPLHSYNTVTSAQRLVTAEVMSQILCYNIHSFEHLLFQTPTKSVVLNSVTEVVGPGSFHYLGLKTEAQGRLILQMTCVQTQTRISFSAAISFVV